MKKVFFLSFWRGFPVHFSGPRKGSVGIHSHARQGAVLIVALLGLLSTEGLAQSVLVAKASDGRTAWAVVREGKAPLTEVWVADKGGEPRRVRAFPGRPEGIAWEGDHLYYTDRGLKLPLLRGRTDQTEVEVEIAPGQRWIVALNDGEDAPVSAPPITPLSTPSSPDSRLPTPDLKPDMQPALDAMWQALNLVMEAYDAAQRGDFKNASFSYDRAADWFENLPAEVRKVGMSKAVCRSYAGELRRRAKETGQEMGRGVCADHLRIIGGFLKGYAAAHKDQLPKNLETLKSWVEQQGPAGLLFRAPVDADTGQVSYGYRPPRPGDPDGMPVVWSYYYTGRAVELVRAGDDLRGIDRPLGKAQVDSLFAIGVRALEADSLAGAIQAFKGVTYVAHSWGKGHARLGYAYLKAGQLDRAEAAFQRTIEVDRTVAEAHNGRGLIFMKKNLGLQWAIESFQEALRWNPRYAEARHHIAEIRLKLKQYDARSEAEKAIALDPTYAPPYRLMGDWWDQMQDDYEKAILWYIRYMAMRPQDTEARLQMGRLYLKARNFEGTTKMLMDYAQQHPEEIHILPILAQACLEMKRLDWAQNFYSRYLDGVGPQERVFYEDIRLVVYPEELTEYEAVVKTGQGEAFLKRFWAKRDPDLITPINERLLEHYRRVWYARMNFSARKQPWDRRGEVYIRFGEPDHRSRSDQANFQQSLAVQRVKESMAQDLYGKSADIGTYLGPVYPLKGGRQYDFAFTTGQQGAQEMALLRAGAGDSPERRKQLLNETSIGTDFNTTGMGVEGNFSSTATAQEGTELVPWETWVYTKINGGFEITFTDEFQNDNYDYAPQVLDARIPPDRLRQFSWYAPQAVFQRASAVTPDYYSPKIDAPPLKFYYDLADFRGKDGHSALEVYFGIPQVIGRYLLEQDSTRMVVDRQVALLNLETGATFRTQSELAFQGAGDLTRQPGAFIPDVARLEVPPGKYRLEVTAKDRQSGRMGTYRQDVGIVSYGKGALRLSGLVLAWQVGEGQEGDKFTRHGLRIVPLPTRTFRKGQNIFVYYEVYNLKPDSTGVTRHSVEYTLKTEAGGVLSRVLPGFTGAKPEVAVSQTQAGRQEAEYRYIELDLQGLSPGKGTLTVTVKDLNSGQATMRELVFTMAE
ncbi:MAG: GWxTD domain-containing protein [Candidatus Latescibacteria bacterium]|nr:GWxTD domain-containing protein [Candidatus Latescibacterota bacterium]